MATVADGSFPTHGGVSIARTSNNLTSPVTFHRIAEVREQQGLSLRAISRRMGIAVSELKQQELPDTNLSLAELYQWQQALEVPIQHLLRDSDGSLSETTQIRAALVKIMKTVMALSEVASSPRVVRLTTMLREQMIEMMPELTEIGGWPNYGSRRPPDQLGRIAEQPIDVNSLSIE